MAKPPRFTPLPTRGVSRSRLAWFVLCWRFCPGQSIGVKPTWTVGVSNTTQDAAIVIGSAPYPDVVQDALPASAVLDGVAWSAATCWASRAGNGWRLTDWKSRAHCFSSLQSYRAAISPSPARHLAPYFSPQFRAAHVRSRRAGGRDSARALGPDESPPPQCCGGNVTEWFREPHCSRKIRRLARKILSMCRMRLHIARLLG